MKNSIFFRIRTNQKTRLLGYAFTFASVGLQASSTVEEVTITDMYRASENSAVSFIDLDRDFFAQRNFGQEPSFILTETPSFTAYSDSGSGNGYSYFRLRGMDQTRINMTLNGVPLNEPEDQGVYFSNYPDFFSSIGSAQIQRGVGLTQNGSASYAGSIQFSTDELYYEPKSLVELNHGSFNSQRTAVQFQSNELPVKFYARGSHVKSDGYKRRSEHSASSAFVGARYESFGVWQLTAFHGEQDNQLAWLGVSRANIEADRTTNGNAEEDDIFEQSLIIVNHELDTGSGATYSGVYFNTLEGNYDFDLNNFLGLPSTNELYNYALDSKFFGGFANYQWQQNNLDITLGAHANNYIREHIGSERTLGELYRNEGQKNSRSAYIKTLYYLGYWLVLTDVQYRETGFDYTGDVAFSQLNWHFVNPKLGITYLLNDQSLLYYSVGRTSREPTRTDIFGGNDYLDIDGEGAPLIFITQEEEVVNHELGFRQSSERFSISANLYYMSFNNEIVLNGQFGPNGLALNENVDSSIRSGIELSADYTLSDSISGTTSLAHSRNKIKDSGTSFDPVLSPETLIYQSLSYLRENWQASVSARYQSSSYLDFANSEKIVGFTVVDATLSYKTEQFEASLFANNLLNREYATSGYVDTEPKYFVGAPRHYSLQLRVYF